MVSFDIATVTEAIKLAEPLPRNARLALGFLGAAAAVAVTARHWDEGPIVAVALGALMVVATLLAAIDLAVHRLPNIIVGPLAAAVTVAIAINGFVEHNLGHVLWSIGIGIGFSLLFFVGNLLAGVGMGDVKYAYPVFAVAGWYGPVTIQTTLLVMVLSAAAVAVVVLARGKGRQTAIAYGPYMSLGLAAGLLIS